MGEKIKGGGGGSKATQYTLQIVLWLIANILSFSVERSVSNIYDRRPKDKIGGAAAGESSPSSGVTFNAVENLAEVKEDDDTRGSPLALASPGSAASNKAFRRDIPNRRYVIFFL